MQDHPALLSIQILLPFPFTRHSYRASFSAGLGDIRKRVGATLYLRQNITQELQGNLLATGVMLNFNIDLGTINSTLYLLG